MLREKKKKINTKIEQKNVFDNTIRCLSFYLKANSATVSPPLSSVLGNLGLNTLNFCKEFNKLTELVDTFIIFKVYLKVNISTKSWDLKLGSIPVTKLFRFLSFKKNIQFTGLGGFYVKQFFYISLLNIFLVILFQCKKPTEVVQRNMLSILQSMDMLVERDGIFFFVSDSKLKNL